MTYGGRIVNLLFRSIGRLMSTLGTMHLVVHNRNDDGGTMAHLIGACVFLTSQKQFEDKVLHITVTA